MVLAVSELLEIVGGDVLELREYRAPLRPFAVLAIVDVAHHRRESVAVHVFAELVGIEALGPFDRLRQHLAGGVTERHEAIAERIDFFARRRRTITFEQIGIAGEIEGRHEAFHDDDAVE